MKKALFTLAALALLLSCTSVNKNDNGGRENFLRSYGKPVRPVSE